MTQIVNKLKYGVTEIARKGHKPSWWRQRFASRVAGPALGQIYNNDGVHVMEQDWDNLLILDACRGDMFEEGIDTGQFDSYKRVHSMGTSSPDWMRQTFTGDRSYPDTVYITGNPWISKIAPESFCQIRNLWLENYSITSEDLQGAIDLGDVDAVDTSKPVTIYADDLTQAAKEIYDEYPNKRLIVHYFQPHAPVVGNSDGTRKKNIPAELNPGSELHTGKVTKEAVWDAYIENLQFAFHHAKDLAESIGGKSVYTSDHGELFGERMWPFPIRAYQHPTGLRHPKLTEVPWAEQTVGDRRTIEAGNVEIHEADLNEIDNRLEQLGYKT
jgi:hypothetical protein